MFHPQFRTWFSLLLLALLPRPSAADAPRTPEYLAIVRSFADTLLSKGRDVYGPRKTALWLSVINVEDFSVPRSAKEVPAPRACGAPTARSVTRTFIRNRFQGTVPFGPGGEAHSFGRLPLAEGKAERAEQ
jgi:hypothetical protein